jgi:hypothetical protein
MIDNLNSEEEVSGLRQVVMAVISIIAIFGLWSFLDSL